MGAAFVSAAAAASRVPPVQRRSEGTNAARVLCVSARARIRPNRDAARQVRRNDMLSSPPPYWCRLRQSPAARWKQTRWVGPRRLAEAESSYTHQPASPWTFVPRNIASAPWVTKLQIEHVERPVTAQNGGTTSARTQWSGTRIHVNPRRRDTNETEWLN